MAKTQPKLVNERLAAAMSHPTRVHAMAILSLREASPKEISKEINEPLNNVSYHLNQLIDLGCIELVRTVPAKGGRVVEHFYRASRSSWIRDEEWEAFGPSERQVVYTTLMRTISADVNAAMATGTFFDPGDNHLSRTPMNLDAEGWAEVQTLLDDTLSALLDIRSRAATRISENVGAKAFPARVNLLQYRSPERRGESA